MEDKYWNKLKKEVIDAGLCTHCGSCVGLSEDLEFQKECNPVPYKKGNNQIPEMCYTACPGRSINYPELNKTIFNKLPKNWLIGNYVKIFIGYATDEKIRTNSSSGGIITQSLLYLLEKKMISGSVVLNTNKQKPYKSNPVITKTKKEIINSAQSVYVVTPLNTILSQVKKFKGKLAYVGLPDEVASIRKLQHQGKFKQFEYILGPYVGIYMQKGAIESYLRSNGIKSLNDIIDLKYRAGEWPGYLQIKLKNRRVLKTSKFYYNYLLPFYITNSSLYMCDFTNELTDISVGDAWSPKYERIGKGFSVVVARTKKGLNLLKDMEKASLIHLEEISEKEALSMHGHMLDFKKRGSFIRLDWKNRFIKKGKPFYGYEPEKIAISRKFVEAINFIIFAVCRTKVARKAIEYIPITFLGYWFNIARKTWKSFSKPTKRKGLYSQKFRIIQKTSEK